MPAAVDGTSTARKVALAAGASGRALRRQAATDIMRVLASQRVDPAEAIEAIVSLGDDPEQRARLGKHYEAMLRDGGREVDAIRFSRALADALGS